MLARQVYDSLVIAIDIAYERRGFKEVCGEADRLGMTGGEVNSFNSLRYEYTYKDSEGQTAELVVRSYDPSGPFQNEPDINRFTAKLFKNGMETALHDRQYSE